MVYEPSELVIKQWALRVVSPQVSHKMASVVLLSVPFAIHKSHLVAIDKSMWIYPSCVGVYVPSNITLWQIAWVLDDDLVISISQLMHVIEIEFVVVETPKVTSPDIDNTLIDPSVSALIIPMGAGSVSLYPSRLVQVVYQSMVTLASSLVSAYYQEYLATCTKLNSEDLQPRCIVCQYLKITCGNILAATKARNVLNSPSASVARIIDEGFILVEAVEGYLLVSGVQTTISFYFNVTCYVLATRPPTFTWEPCLFFIITSWSKTAISFSLGCDKRKPEPMTTYISVDVIQIVPLPGYHVSTSDNLITEFSIWQASWQSLQTVELSVADRRKVPACPVWIAMLLEYGEALAGLQNKEMIVCGTDFGVVTAFDALIALADASVTAIPVLTTSFVSGQLLVLRCQLEMQLICYYKTGAPFWGTTSNLKAFRWWTGINRSAIKHVYCDKFLTASLTVADAAERFEKPPVTSFVLEVATNDHASTYIPFSENWLSVLQCLIGVNFIAKEVLGWVNLIPKDVSACLSSAPGSLILEITGAEVATTKRAVEMSDLVLGAPSPTKCIPCSALHIHSKSVKLKGRVKDTWWQYNGIQVFACSIYMCSGGTLVELLWQIAWIGTILCAFHSVAFLWLIAWNSPFISGIYFYLPHLDP